MEKPANHATESKSPVQKSDDHDNTHHSNEATTETPKSESSPQPNLNQVMEAVDDLIHSLSSATDPLREIPPSVEPFPETVDSLVSKIEFSGLGRDESEDSSFINAVNRISKSVSRLRELKLDSTPVSSWLNRASSVQHRAVSLFNEEFRHFLDPSKEERKHNNHHGDQKSNPEKNEEEEEKEERFPN